MLDGDLIDFKPEVLTLASLISWLETKDPNTEYRFCDSGNCLLHQYFVASGFNMPVSHGVGGSSWHERGGEHRPLPEHFSDIAVKPAHTFGAALERAIEFETLA